VVAATPVEGFRVSISPAGREPMGRMLAQDLEFAGDKFDVDDVPPSEVLASVRTRDGRVGEARTTLVSGQTGEVEVQLKDATTVTGRIVGPDGAPVKSAMVTVADGDAIMAGANSETTADGRFHLANVQPGEHAIRVFAPPATFKRQTFTVAAGQALDVGDIKLDPPRADPGTVGANLRPDGDGVAVGFVLPGGPADTAGLKIGDLVTAIDGARVASVDDARARAPGAPGSPVTFTVSRTGNAVSVPMVRAR
jgi:membrane-associated protease RseP (regulator of RpoE activity)